MGSLLVVTGPPGSGKSTVAAALVERRHPSALVEGDEFFRFLRNGMIDPWLPESHRQNELVTRVQATAAGQFRDGGLHTVYDSVLGPWFLDVFHAVAGDPLDYVVLLPPFETCLHRIRTRADHGFEDEDAARSMYDQFAAACAESGARTVDSSVGSPDDVADAIEALRASGRLRCG